MRRLGGCVPGGDAVRVGAALQRWLPSLPDRMDEQKLRVGVPGEGFDWPVPLLTATAKYAATVGNINHLIRLIGVALLIVMLFGWWVRRRAVLCEVGEF